MLEEVMNRLQHRFSTDNPLSFEEWELDPEQEQDRARLRAAIIARTAGWLEGTIDETHLSVRLTGQGHHDWAVVRRDLELFGEEVFFKPGPEKRS